MDYFSIERLDILKKYNSIDHISHKLDHLYRNVWKVYLQSITTELVKRNNLKTNFLKIKNIQEKKRSNHLAIHELLNNAVRDKLSICLYTNNKIYLVSGSVNMKFKEKQLNVKALNKQRKIMSSGMCKDLIWDEKQIHRINKLNNINRSILLFHTIYLKECNSVIIEKKIEKLSKNIKRYSKQLHTKYERMDSINKSISSLDKKCIEAECSIKNAVEKSKKKNKIDLNSIRYLSSEIYEIQKQYNYEIDHINKLYNNEFIRNKKQMCSICLEEDCRFIKTSCGHYFHVECITLYLEKIIYNNNFINITCPMCRQNIS